MKTRAMFLALMLLLAGCSQSATAPADPVGPRLNGGMTMGGGLAVDTTRAPQTSAVPTCTEEGRGGMTMGGGLYTGSQPCP